VRHFAEAITVTGTESSTVSYKGSSKGALYRPFDQSDIDCFIYFSIIFNRNHLIQIGIVQRMIREIHSLVGWFVRRQYQFCCGLSAEITINLTIESFSNLG
jgi:hypothetical protein